MFIKFYRENISNVTQIVLLLNLIYQNSRVASSVKHIFIHSTKVTYQYLEKKKHLQIRNYINKKILRK